MHPGNHAQLLFNVTYNYSATQNNGRIVSSQDGITGENTSYTYDALNRLTAASNSSWNQSYTYDGFGNLLTKSYAGGSPNPSPAMSVSYNAKNQIANASYDANGNLQCTSNYSNCYTYNVENRMVSSANPSTVYAYDPWGKRVMVNQGGASGTYTYTFYGITGQPLAMVQCNASNFPAYPTCAIVGQNVYFGRKMIVSGGVNVVTDRLGNIRANSQGEYFSYYPYGEERTSTVDGRPKFGTYFRDAVGQDYADQRYYGSGSGSFWSPDRTGGSAASPASLNRYTYVQGDTVNFADPRGAYLVDVGGGVLLDCGHGAESIYDGTCTGTDGGWGGDSEGGAGCGSSMGSGFIEAPDPDPVSGCSNDSPPPPPPICQNPVNPVSQAFVQRNFNAAAATANSMGIGGEDGDADILTLSGLESGWGTFANGYQGAYFGMQALVGTPRYAGETTCASIKGTKQYCEMEFSSFAAAAAVFANKEYSVVNGASDPITFFYNLSTGSGFAHDSYPIPIQYLQYALPTWQWVG